MYRFRFRIGNPVWYNGETDPYHISEGDVSLLQEGKKYTIQNRQENDWYTLLYIGELHSWYNSVLFDEEPPRPPQRVFGAIAYHVPQVGQMTWCYINKFNDIALESVVPSRTTEIISVTLRDDGDYNVTDSRGDQYVMTVIP